jgi:hypothetical protein
MSGMPNLPGNTSFFVTRQKRDAVYEVRESRKINKKQGLISDQTIRLNSVKAQECPRSLRRIVYKDFETGKRLLFLTNHFQLALA